MSKELKYYFSFGQNHSHPKTGQLMKDYWIEIIADETYCKDENETVRWYSFRERSRQAMSRRFGIKWSNQYHPDDFKPEYFPAGCYEKIYLPLPEDLETEIKDDPFNEVKFIMRLNVIKSFQNKFPQAHVGGSIGLMLHGIDLKRDLSNSDIDMTVDDYIPEINEPSDYSYNPSSKDFDYQYISGKKDDYIKMDIRVNPEPGFEIINYNGINYQVSKLRDILFWKRKYAKKGIQKHIDDLKFIF